MKLTKFFDKKRFDFSKINRSQTLHQHTETERQL